MFDKSLVLSMLLQINEAIDKILFRTKYIISVDDFTNSPSGMEKLDSVCMLFIAIGESLKKIDRMTDNNYLINYSGIDWKGVIGFRDIISHQYFDVDAEQVFWICKNELPALADKIKVMIKDLKK